MPRLLHPTLPWWWVGLVEYRTTFTIHIVSSRRCAGTSGELLVSPTPPQPLPTRILCFSYPAGYDEGNLNWLAAFEVEPAGDVMALRVWKTEELTPMQAQAR